jgi:hypothetical protein
MCTWTEIVNANKLIATTDIKGKQYAEVNQRIKAFRSVHPNGSIQSELISLEGGVCTFRVVVSDSDGKILGTGTAQEKESSSFINKTSYIENCETSAVGRALGMCGFGIDTSVASYEEVANAIENQSNPKKDEGEKSEPKMSSRDKLISYLYQNGMDIEAYSKEHNLNKTTPAEVFDQLLQQLIEADKVDTSKGFSSIPGGTV